MSNFSEETSIETDTADCSKYVAKLTIAALLLAFHFTSGMIKSTCLGLIDMPSSQFKTLEETWWSLEIISLLWSWKDFHEASYGFMKFEVSLALQPLNRVSTTSGYYSNISSMMYNICIR